jgi:NADH-quinone oxidoreductase subunit N
VLFGIFLLSLLGIPPLAGFVAKFQVFMAVFHAGRDATAGPHPWLGTVYYALLLIGGLNTAVSAFYYVRVLKVMTLERPAEAVEGREPAPLRLPAAAVTYAGVMAAAVVGLGVAFQTLAVASEQGVQTFATTPPVVEANPVLPTGELGGPRPKAPKGKAQPKGKARPKANPGQGE